MKEQEFIKTIKETLSRNSHIGDDCAYLRDLGIVVTQDSLVEDIHFSRKFSTPHQLGYKSVAVNLSDIFASGATPKYITVSLSLPKNIDSSFVKEFYRACEELSKKYDFEVVGGDITGSDKIYISVCAIGLTASRTISSRCNAKVGDYVITTGNHGSSAAGLWILSEKGKGKGEKISSTTPSPLVKTHLLPEIQSDFSNQISKLNTDYAMMDTSDGLVDALFKMSQASGVSISVDFNKIPYDKSIEKIAESAKKDFKDWVLYGGEDYQMVACVNESLINKLSGYTIIGRVREKSENYSVEVFFDDKIEKISDLEKTFNHFGGTK